jgi:hypothetical protein
LPPLITAAASHSKWFGDQLPGGLYEERSFTAFCRTCLISTCVNNRVNFTFCSVPAVTVRPKWPGPHSD